MQKPTGEAFGGRTARSWQRLSLLLKAVSWRDLSLRRAEAAPQGGEEPGSSSRVSGGMGSPPTCASQSIGGPLSG